MICRRPDGAESGGFDCIWKSIHHYGTGLSQLILFKPAHRKFISTGILFIMWGMLDDTSVKKIKFLYTGIQKLFHSAQTRNHVIAVRYSSGLKALPSYAIDYGRFNGFDISIEDWNTALNAVHETVGQQMTFTTILGAFAFIHIILFIFYPKFRENLFYSLSTIGIGAVWFFNDLSLFLVSEKQLVLLNRIIQTSIYIAIVSGFYLVHYLTRLKFPKRWNAYVALGVLLAAWGIVYENQVYFRLTDAYIVVAMVEMTWMAFRAPRTDVVAGYILKVGFLVFGAAVIYGIVASYLNFPRISAQHDEYIYGVTALGIAMSVFLSRRFALTNRDLEVQLGQVRELSEQTLAREREAREKEIERRLLTADNERKTKELEEARDLQLLDAAEKPADYAEFRCWSPNADGD